MTDLVERLREWSKVFGTICNEGPEIAGLLGEAADEIKELERKNREMRDIVLHVKEHETAIYVKNMLAERKRCQDTGEEFIPF